MNTKVTRKQVEEARNYLYNINTQYREFSSRYL